MRVKTSSHQTSSRIFIGFVEISGYYGRLINAIRETGNQVTFREIAPHKFNYNSSVARMNYRYEHLLSAVPGAKWTLMGALKRRLTNVHFFLWCLNNHDVFVFVYGQSFLKSNLDLVLLRLLNKRIVSLVWHGSEARPAYIDGALWDLCRLDNDPIQSIYRHARRQKRLISRLEMFSHDIIAAPLSSHFLSKSAINSSFIGIPPPVRVPNDNKENNPLGLLLIVHAPSNRSVKGSNEIKAVINKLEIEFPDTFAYRELHGLSNEEVLTALSTADLLIDQLFSDTVLPGIGIEAASYGVPSLVGSYGVENLRQAIPSEFFPPAFVVAPSEFESKLRFLLENREEIYLMGQAAKDFAETSWSVENVAERFVQVILGTYPTNWRFEPKDIAYVYGGGLSADLLTHIIRKGFERFGIRFFSLPSRPDLVSIFTQRFLIEDE